MALKFNELVNFNQLSLQLECFNLNLVQIMVTGKELLRTLDSD